MRDLTGRQMEPQYGRAKSGNFIIPPIKVSQWILHANWGPPDTRIFFNILRLSSISDIILSRWATTASAFLRVKRGGDFEGRCPEVNCYCKIQKAQV